MQVLKTNNKHMPYTYVVSYAPTGRAQCKFCGQLIKEGTVRVTRETDPIEHLGGHSIVNHFHYRHAFNAMKRSNCKSNVILNQRSLKGLAALKPKDKKSVLSEITKFNGVWKRKCSRKGLRPSLSHPGSLRSPVSKRKTKRTMKRTSKTKRSQRKRSMKH